MATDIGLSSRSARLGCSAGYGPPVVSLLDYIPLRHFKAVLFRRSLRSRYCIARHSVAGRLISLVMSMAFFRADSFARHWADHPFVTFS